MKIRKSMNVDEANDVEELSSEKEPMETTSGYHGSNHGPSGWYWDIIDNMDISYCLIEDDFLMK